MTPVQLMKVCPQCQRSIPRSANFCPYCTQMVQHPLAEWLTREGISLLFGAAVILWLAFTWFDLAGSNRPSRTQTVRVTQVNELRVVVTATPSEAEASHTPTSTPPPTITPTPLPTQSVATTDGMVQLRVPSGASLFGSSQPAEAGPVSPRIVYLAEFWIDQTEVTNAQFAAFLNANGNQLEQGIAWLALEQSQIELQNTVFQPLSPTLTHPVTNVSWYGAAAYCQWAGRRLPTEAEWVKAARGVGSIHYPWGTTLPTCETSNYGFCVGTTTSVGTYPADVSPSGALDMFGNVREWVADWYSADYWDSSPNENPTGPPQGNLKLVHGGWWESDETIGRTYNRSAVEPTNHPEIGFRCAQDAN